MVGWHHELDGHGFGWTPGIGAGQGGLVCCGSWALGSITTNKASEGDGIPAKPFQILIDANGFISFMDVFSLFYDIS